MKKKKREQMWYPRIRNFMIGELNAFGVGEEIYVSDVGRADIVLAVDIGGEMGSDVEMNAVEVKIDSNDITNKIAQTLKYSLFAHRCYLAVKFRKDYTFNFEHLHLAQNFGIGLIEFGHEGMRIVNYSDRFTPLENKTLESLKKLGLFKCNICGNLMSKDDFGNSYEIDLHTNWLRNGKPDQREVLFKKSKAIREVKVCKTCFERLGEIPRY